RGRRGAHPHRPADGRGHADPEASRPRPHLRRAEAMSAAGKLADAVGPRLTRRIGIAATLPTQLLLIFIIAFPTLVTVYISLTAWSPLDGIPWYKAFTSWSWFDNYLEIFDDDRFGGAILRTLLLVASAVAAEFILGFALAL